MMRMILAIPLLLVAATAQASAYALCNAPLVVPQTAQIEPRPELTFTLTLGNQSGERTFTAEGKHFDGAQEFEFLWRGTWFSDAEHGHQLVGRVETAPKRPEWRGRNSDVAEADVFILHLDRGDGLVLPIRCLPKDRV